MSSDPTQFAPELRLLLAAIQHHADSNVNLPIGQDLDWDRVCAAAAHHRLLPLLHRLVQVRADLQPPEATRQFLAAQAQAQLHHYLLLAAELNALLALFSQAGIEAIPYKGPALAAQLYDLPELRPAGDLDFLILPEQLLQAEVLLRQQGYRAGYELSPAQWTLVFKNEEEIVLSRAPGLHVELHWRFAPRQFAVDFHLRQAWQRSRLREFCGWQARTLSPEDQLLALVIHGSKHAWERLIWLSDLALLLRRYPALEWERIVAEAQSLGMARMLAIALAIVEALLAAALPPEIKMLTAQADTRKLAEAYLSWLQSSLTPGGAFEWSVSRRHFFIVRGRERLRDRWFYLWRLAVLPTAEELQLIPLPRPLHPLYTGIRASNLLRRLFRQNTPTGSTGGGGRSAKPDDSGKSNAARVA